MILCVVILALLAVLVATEDEPHHSTRAMPPRRASAPRIFRSVAPEKKVSTSKQRGIHRPSLHAMVALIALFFTGCVSSKYKLAAKQTPPAVMLHLSAAPAASAPENVPTPAVEATVESVIVFGGPGSWKRAAYWDEYVVSLANHHADALILEEAALTDFQGAIASPGKNPWELERESRNRTAQLRSTAGNILHLGAGMVGSGLVGMASGAVVGPVVLGSSWFGPVIEGAATGLVAAVPVYIASSVYLNVSRKHDVEAEFKKRDLHLPTSLAPGETIRGSLFFRISPGPRQLMLRYRIGNETREAIIDLAPLSSLHLKTIPLR